MLGENGEASSGCSSAEKHRAGKRVAVCSPCTHVPVWAVHSLLTCKKGSNSVTAVWDSKHRHLLEAINSKCPYFRLRWEGSFWNCSSSRCLLKLGVTMRLKGGTMKEGVGGAPLHCSLPCGLNFIPAQAKSPESLVSGSK